MENQRPCSSNLLQSHVCIDHLLGRPGTSGHKVAEGTFSCVKAWAAVATLKPDLGMPIWDALVLPMTNIAKKLVSASGRSKLLPSVGPTGKSAMKQLSMRFVSSALQRSNGTWLLKHERKRHASAAQSGRDSTDQGMWADTRVEYSIYSSILGWPAWLLSR